MRTKSISRNKNTQPAKGFFFKRNPQRQHSFFESTASNKFFGGVAETIYRKCDECNKEEQVQRKTSAADTPTKVPSQAFINKLNTSGQTLSSDQQYFFGRRMNHDFGEVKIHTGGEAVQSASNISAQAYTYKNHIVFNEGKYNPSSDEGKKLLAHELSHVIQQSPSSLIHRQQHPQTEWIPPDVGPGRSTVRDLTPDDPVERERWSRGRDADLNTRQDQLRNVLVPFIERADAAGLVARLRALSRREAFDILYDEEFMNILQAHFHGVTLWSIFSIMLDRGDPDPLVQRLNVAILSQQAQLVADILGLMRSSGFMNLGRRQLLRIALPQIFGGHRLLQEMLSLVQDAQPSEVGRVFFNAINFHYDTDEHGQMGLRAFGGPSTVDYRTTATQMRVVVPMDFVQPGNHSQPFHFIAGNLPSILENWLNTITRVWNNQFYLSNGRQNLLLVFVPIAVHSGPNQIEVHTNNRETCPGVAEQGRAEGHCYFTSDSGNTIAHEFGHLMGAGDEYNLPATAAEIPQALQAGTTGDDIRLSTVEGIEHRRPAAAASGHDISDSLMSNPEASQRVYERHILRLVNAINAQLPGGTPQYQIRRPGS